MPVDMNVQRGRYTWMILIMFAVLASLGCWGVSATASEESQRFHQQGVKVFNENRFEEAAGAFQKAVQADARDSKAQFQMGLVLYKMGEYDKAIPHLDLAKELDPLLGQPADYYVGLCYLWQGKDRDAEKRFQRVIAADPKSDLAESARRFLTTMREKIVEKERPERKIPIYLQAAVSVQYDSNVIIKPQETTVDLPPTDKDDVASVLWFQADYRPFQTSNFYAGAAYYIYQSFYADLHQYNMTGHFPTVYAAYIQPPFFADIRYRFHYYNIDNESFVRIHQVRPRISYSWSPRSFTDFYAAYEKKHFFVEPLREANNLSGGLMHYQFFRDDKLRLNIGYVYENEDARGPDYDYRNHRFTLGAQYSMWDKVKVGIEGNFWLKDYNNVDSFVDKRRKDQRQDYLAFARYDIFDFLGVQLLYNGIFNGSNLGFREYERHIVSLSLYASY